MTGTEIFKGAKFIDCEGSTAPVFQKLFNAKKGENACITICGLGFFRLYINGTKVSEDLNVPNATNYSERDLSKFEYPLVDKMKFRTYVMKYDISAYLKDGENEMVVYVGPGYYCQEKKGNEGYVSFGYPKLCYVIEKEDGDIISDSSTLVSKGFVSDANLYRGEIHDYTLPLSFAPAREIETPDSSYQLNFCPTDKVIESITSFTLLEDDGTTRLYDCGINTVGYAVIKCEKANEKITVAYAEDIYDKENFGIHFRENYQREVFITDGSDREYIPFFTWHGFRYIKITGDAQLVRVDVVHSDCPVSSSFESDNEQLNWLYETYIHTQLCNMHSGVPSDCPHRERLGYTGDGQLCCEAVMLMLDCKEFYRKWLYDIADNQCTVTGHVGHTAPLMGGGGGPAGWGGAMVEVPYKFYKIYGDKELLSEFFPMMLRYLDYLEMRSDNGLVWHEEKDGWCLGDWLPPDPIKIPETYVNTCLYIKFMQQVTEIADILGRQSEIKHLAGRIERVKKAVDIAYFSPQQRAYCGDIQGASCLALQVGMGNEGVVKKVVEKYKRLGQYDSGIIVTEALTGYLFGIGEAQTAFDLLASKGDVSFDYMHRNGATTIWENWNGESSKNHPMFGAATKYLFTYLLGISQEKDSAGFRKPVISPCFVEGMDRCSGHITTVNGEISVSYVKADGKAEIDISVPDSVQASFVYGNIHKYFSGKAHFSVEV